MDLFADILAGIIALPSMAWIWLTIEIWTNEKDVKFLFPTFNDEKPKWVVFRLVYMFFNMIAAIVLPFGVALCSGDWYKLYVGIILIAFVVAVLAPTVVQCLRGLSRARKAKREKAEKAAELKKETDKILFKPVHVIIDRPLGSVHPEHDDIVYEVNYGYVKGVIGGDGEEQDVYLLGVYEPVKEFDGIVTAVIHRNNDSEDKWVVVPEGEIVTDDEIRRKTEFMEKYFDIEIIR